MRRLFVFALLIGLGGCSSTSFVGGRLNNFTAYYNTFYNAERAFEKGQKATRERTGSVDRQVYRPVFPLFDTPAASRDFEDAIQKSADVLRSHETSKWVDDALLLIGKSYFYQQNYFAAEEKFREVVGLGTKREDEARYWLARTLLASLAYDALSDHLIATFDREKTSRKWAPYLRLVQGELLVRRGELAEAVGPLELGARAIKDRTLSSRANYLLGQLNESLGQFDDAIASYKRAQRKNSDFDLVFAAQLSVARSQASAGNVEGAFRELRRMERDDKNFELLAEIRALRGRMLAESGRTDEAMTVFKDVLRNSERLGTDVKGDIHYRLASIYRDEFQDFELASAHFDTAATSLSAQIEKRVLDGQKFGIQDPFVPWAIRDAREQKDVFGTFAFVAGQVAEMDSLLELSSLDEEAFDIRIDEIRRQRRAELSALAKQRQQQQVDSDFRNVAGAAAANRTTAGGKNIPSASGAGAAAANESGFLFHKDIARVQEGFQNFVARWGERPAVPGWRLSSRLLASSAKSGDVPDKRAARARQVAGNLLGSDSFGAEFDDIEVGNVPRTEKSIAAMRTARASARYQVGTVLFLSMNRPDSAAAWFRKVITDDEDEVIAPKAYYALAEVNSVLGDDARADELRVALRERYPDHDEANDTLAAEEQRQRAVIASAEREYATYYESWQAQQFPVALTGMLALAESSDPSIVAPQALYAAGSVLIDWARTDSRSIFEPVALPLPDSVAQWLGLEVVGPKDADTVSTADPKDAVAPPDPKDAVAPPDSTDTVVRPDPKDAVAFTDVEDSVTVADPENAVTPPVPVLDLETPGASVDTLALGEAVDSTTVSTIVSTTVPQPPDVKPHVIRHDSTAVDTTGSRVRMSPGDAAKEGSLTVRTDSVSVSVENVLNLVTSRYSSSAYAALARKQLEMIGQLRAEAQMVADSLANLQAAADSAAAMQHTDSLSVDTLSGTTLIAADSLDIGVTPGDPMPASPAVVRDSTESVAIPAVVPDSIGRFVMPAVVPDSTDSVAIPAVVPDSTDSPADGERAPSFDRAPESDELRLEEAAARATVAGAAISADSVYSSDALDTPPFPIGGLSLIKEQMALPDTLSPAGFIDFQFVVTPDGMVSEAAKVLAVIVDQNLPIDAVEDDSFATTVEAMAMKALLNSRFTPGKINGIAVTTRMTIKLTFGDEQPTGN